MQPLLQIEDVYKQYGDKQVLDNIDLSVRKGEFCTVVGPSGCGKSTLLRLILGQEQPTSGKVEIAGAPALLPDLSRGIVYQRYSLFPNRTVLDNVMLGKTLTQGQWWNPWYRNKAHEEEAMAMLAQVRLADAARKYPHELSGGMQQRVAIAQALIMKPPILLMDEPFGALDPDTRADLQVHLLELWEKEQLTVFFVTHDMHEACLLGTRLLVLSQYYSDDRGDRHFAGRGGKIVADHPLPKVATSREVMHTDAFKELIEQVKQEGFDPEYLQHVKDFNLKHPDSFQTLLDAEYRR
ncbi:ABC-type nitrate/sulfonate/bicarbonate transport system, ATPase component [Hahella chejuensis KCTC 2396]|uniref:ABC-type nitrate/sulfonate/bicarbonate transport system, ATPase component n=1 Tax=Hahella chejuensis (strain KCTC 2396) TaxID=349521 RepID=Q2SB89_HAHCH|nr:ABC transporter ATP-binding protein [Hahella chejuensis]ABC32085.1 ABC-type nitrate/sulfonate/bicarbonate transport system, ATPase component [Hahella chejuensis KCTC 2396]